MINTKHIQTLTQTTAAIAALTACTLSAFGAQENWQDKAISPVANPIFFEDPRITSEARPLFINHWLPNSFHYAGGNAPLGGEVQVYALQLRYALTERLALIATKDGYIAMHPNNTLSHENGWANLAAGLKYAVIDDRDRALIVTPGFTIELPTGDTEVLQGRGSGEFNPFVSAEKGFGDFHVTGNLGARVPVDFNRQTAQLHYSLQADYYVCQYFIPFVVGNGYTVLSKGNQQLLGAVPLNTEMSDLINFGSSDARGKTQITAGAGFRSKLTKSLDFGFAYEVGVSKPVGIFESRVTTDLIWRF